MEKLIKRPLKITAAAMFVVALGYGVATNSEFSESGKTNDVTLSALGSVSAQGEENDPCSESKWDVHDDGNGTIVCVSGGSCECPC